MLNLSAKNIRLNGSASNKEEVIRFVAAELVAKGNVAAGYEVGMLNRETQTSTFLGNGIAIPHGTLDTRDLVKENRRANYPTSARRGMGRRQHCLCSYRDCG